MTSVLDVSNVSVAIDGKLILSNIGFSLEPGRLACLLGASGCGKTTLLRSIAGFERVVSGIIRIEGIAVSEAGRFIPPEHRNLGMVFQDFALFPHLSVKQNIAFGLGGMTGTDRDRRIDEVAELLKIPDLLRSYPHQLSGGQQQRVAIARSIAPRPGILLLDEPFASMDIDLRVNIASEVREVLKQDGITAVLVSHNQQEAFAMADEIGVIQGGRLVQWGGAYELYHQPATPYVADFIGEGVFITGAVMDEYRVQTELGIISAENPHGKHANDKVSVLIRPEAITIDPNGGYEALITAKSFRGAEYLYTLKLHNGSSVLGLISSHIDYRIGEMLPIRLAEKHAVLFDPDKTES